MKWAARWEGFQYSIFPDGRGNDEYKLTHLHFWVCAPYDLLQSLPYFIFFISGVGKLKKAARNGKVTFGFRVWKICVILKGLETFCHAQTLKLGRVSYEEGEIHLGSEMTKHSPIKRVVCNYYAIIYNIGQEKKG